jgi:hypothetical protein
MSDVTRILAAIERGDVQDFCEQVRRYPLFEVFLRLQNGQPWAKGLIRIDNLQ